jgi:hypothetical protein
VWLFVDEQLIAVKAYGGWRYTTAKRLIVERRQKTRGRFYWFAVYEVNTGRRRWAFYDHKRAEYQAFEPAVARCLIERLEIHHTPKHGSWLNMAEIELSVLSRQCLDRRLPDALTLTQEVAAWEQARNASARPVDWRFTTPDARIKLKPLYPSIQNG